MFRIQLKSLLSLKISVIISFVVFWNAGFLLGRYLGGGDIQASFEPIAMKTAGITSIFVGLFSLLIAASKKMQSILVSPARSDSFRSREFYILAFITCGLGLFYLLVEL